MNYFIECITKKYFQFKGRARRKEFWYFVLFNVIIALVIGIIEVMVSGGNTYQSPGALSSLYTLLVLIPSIAVTVRRLHDNNRSGWWYLMNFVPIVGPIILLIFLVQKGTAGENRFGSDPLA